MVFVSRWCGRQSCLLTVEDRKRLTPPSFSPSCNHHNHHHHHHHHHHPTYRNLRERKGQKLKDFIHVAGPLGISHLVMFTSTDQYTNMRVSRLPRGPTLTFKVRG